MSAVSSDYKVSLEVFEGPLDLLLYLIKKDEIDIYDIPIVRVTEQYMEYLDLMRMLDLNIAGEFLVMAATLMMIKSRMLLPEDERAELEDEEEMDPRWDLVRRLLEYKKFKDAAGFLELRELRQEDVFQLGGQQNVVLAADDPNLALQDVSLFDLIAAFNDVLKNAREEEIGEIFADRFTVADKIEYVVRTVRAGRPVSFRSLFAADASRHEVICTFMALLELIRLRQVNILQEEHFGEIMVEAADADDVPAAAGPDAAAIAPTE